MPLDPGTTLGPYAVTAKIGEGGMGEVYQARDTKLDRDVALKVLPQAFTDDPDRLARFEREAKVLAFNHHDCVSSRVRAARLRPGGSTMRLLLSVVISVLLVVPSYAQLAQPNEEGITYGHVHLNVADIEVHKQLWVEHFGGEVVEKGPLTAIRLPNFLIALTEREPTGGSQGSVMDHFGFKVRSTAAFVEKWRAAGLEVGREFIGAEGMANAYVMAPDGVWVELQEDPSLHVPIAGYHIHFRTPEHEDLLAWYEKVFSLTRRPRGRIDTTTDVPGMNMSFNTTDEPTAPSRGRAIDHIGFEVDNLQAFCQKLEAMGIEFDVSYREVESVELKIAFLTDPAGTYIELTEGYDEY